MAKPYCNLKLFFAANLNVFKLFAIDLNIRCSPVPNKRTTANFTLKTRLSRFNSPSVIHLMLLGSAVFHCHLIYMWNKELLLRALVVYMVSSFTTANVQAQSLLFNRLAIAEAAQWHDLHAWRLTIQLKTYRKMKKRRTLSTLSSDGLENCLEHPFKRVFLKHLFSRLPPLHPCCGSASQSVSERACCLTHRWNMT